MGSNKNTRFFVDIARIDETERMVYGYGTREDVVDSYGTIIDLDSVRKCIPGYAKWGNIREMHQPSAVGRADDITIDEKGVYLGVKVVDDQAWKKVTERVYKGFSIGGKKDYQDGDRIFLKEITEFSLVDRPSNEGCPIDEYRIHGGDIVDKEPKEKTTVDETPVDRSVINGDVIRYAGEEVWDCQTALYALDNIMYLLSKEMCEDHPDAAEQQTALKAVVENLKKFVASEIKEATTDYSYSPGETTILELAEKGGDIFRIKGSELAELMEHPNSDGDVFRKGAAISKENGEKVQAIHDHAADMGAVCRCGDSVAKAAGDDDDLQRLTTLESDVTRLADDVTRLEREKETLVTRISELEKEPEPVRGVLRVITKGEDFGSGKITDEEDTKRIEALPAEQAAAELVKRAHQNPMLMRMS